MIQPLSSEHRQTLLLDLPPYDAERRAIHRRVLFADFGQALGAMVRIGLEAEKAAPPNGPTSTTASTSG